MIRDAYILKSSDDYRRHVCIDALNEDMILSFIEEDITRVRKLKQIIEMLLSNQVNHQLYSSEKIDKDSKDVTAIKLFKGGQNIRIYCKEKSGINGIYYIIIAELLPKKKTQKVAGESKRLIKKVSSYEYEIKQRK